MYKQLNEARFKGYIRLSTLDLIINNHIYYLNYERKTILLVDLFKYPFVCAGVQYIYPSYFKMLYQRPAGISKQGTCVGKGHFSGDLTCRVF